jgi:hypothetical protein
VDQYREDAKALRRSFRSGDAAAIGRAERVLGDRARQRFQLSDALHVVAVEHGYRSWPVFKREAAREERLVDTGREYAPGDPVLVRVVHRGRRTRVSDDRGAVERAGHPPGWREAARAIDDGFVVNVSRQGEVWLPVERRYEAAIVRRIGEASLALYHDLLELTYSSS